MMRDFATWALVVGPNEPNPFYSRAPRVVPKDQLEMEVRLGAIVVAVERSDWCKPSVVPFRSDVTQKSATRAKVRRRKGWWLKREQQADGEV